jgi:hypothetical protein
MSVNRHMIRLNALAALALIDHEEDEDFYSTVATIKDEFADAERFGVEQLPALCLYPVAGAPQPKYEMFGSVEKHVDFMVVAHVAGDTTDLRSQRLYEIEADVNRALMIDPTRGGYAIDTIQVEDDNDSIGMPREGTKPTASAQWKYRSTYFPND